MSVTTETWRADLKPAARLVWLAVNTLLPAESGAIEVAASTVAALIGTSQASTEANMRQLVKLGLLDRHWQIDGPADSVAAPKLAVRYRLPAAKQQPAGKGSDR